MNVEDRGALWRGDAEGRLDRRGFLRVAGGGIAVAGFAGAGLFGPGGGVLLARSAASLGEEIQTSAERYGVPEELLLAMGYVNTLWEMPPPDASVYEKGDLHGRGTYGIMQLVQNPGRNTLGKAADLTGLSERQLKTDRAANVRGGAAVLSNIAGRSKPRSLDGWQEAVAEYGGTQLYAVEVYETLQAGVVATISTGERLVLEPKTGVSVPPLPTTRVRADYRNAAWRPAHGGNYTNANRGPYRISQIVVHVAQGSYSGTINWFQDARASSSAHYVVSRSGNVTQCVRNEDIAWHAGWWDTNRRSIGIEHAGYVGNPRSFTRRMYRSSARLSAYLCRRYNIPVDRGHIIGHNQVPGCPGAGGGASCHTDPGRHWNWTRYINLVRHFR
ncbi:MAG: N-acetylmuramoyl-L-alanine amidase [Rubrobacter sp.]